MAIEQINLGTVVQDGADGDVARVAFTKVNANFADLESRKVEKVAGKQLSTEDYTSAEKMKLDGIESGAQVNTVTSVAGKTGAVALVKGDVGLGNVDNTSDVNKPVSTATQTALNLKANASTQIIAGTGLTGGGTLAADRTLAVSYGTTAGTAAQGDDSRLSNAREWSAGTVSQAEAEAGTATTRLAWTAQRVRQAIQGWWNGATSAFGRGFVAAADAAAGRTALGLGTAATANVQTSPYDTTYMALMAVGAFGIGKFIDLRGTVYETGTPQDLYEKGTVTGFANGGPSGLGVPGLPENSYGTLIVNSQWRDATGLASYSRQFIGGGACYVQSAASATTWGRWVRVYTQDAIVGAVSQSGGVPTGAIIERGSNVNGEYVRFADGTMICTSFLLSGGSVNQIIGYVFRTNEIVWTFPSVFAERPITSGIEFSGVGNCWVARGDSGNESASTSSYRIFSAMTTDSIPYARFMAIGRWY